MLVEIQPVYLEQGISSVGLEHLPYKQGVVGSNPTCPTKETNSKISKLICNPCVAGSSPAEGCRLLVAQMVEQRNLKCFLNLVAYISRLDCHPDKMEVAGSSPAVTTR